MARGSRYVPRFDLRGRSARALGCALALIVFLFARSAGARPKNVVMVVAGDDAEAMSVVVRDLLERQGVILEARGESAIDTHAILERPSSFEPALARVWIDFTPSDHATLTIVDEPWERVLVRRIQRDPKKMDVAREEIGHILETAIEAMLSGARIGLERETLLPRPPPKPVESPPPVRAPPPSVGIAPRVHAGIYEQATIFSNEAPVVHAFGISTSIEIPTALHPAAWLGVAYRFPSWAHTGSIGVKVQAIEVRLLARLTLFSVDAWHVEVAAGPGVDITTVTPLAERASAMVTRPSTDASPIVRGSLALRWKVLSLSVALDVDTLLRDYPFQYGNETVVALSPFRARPVFSLGVEPF